MASSSLRKYIQKLIDYIDSINKGNTAQKLSAASVNQKENTRNILEELQSLGDAAYPDLQQVTDQGHTTTKPITLKNSGGFGSTLSPDNLTEDRDILLPDSSGTLISTINNISPDSQGNITIAGGGLSEDIAIAYAIAL